MHKILKIILVVVGLIAAGLWFMLPDGDMPAAQAAQSGPMNAMFILTYLLLAVGVIASLMFTLKNLISNPKGLKKALFVAVGFLLVVAISYVMSSGTDVSDDFMVMSDESTVKKIGMGLNVFFILTAVAVAAIILPGIKKLFNK